MLPPGVHKSKGQRLTRRWAFGLFFCLSALRFAPLHAQQQLEFSWYVNYEWFSTPNAWGADPISNWIQQKKNVSITWLSPSNDAGSRLNVMVAISELPEVMTLERGSEVERLVAAGLLQPLDPYLDILPNLTKWLGQKTIDSLRSGDGKLYQFPNWYIQPGRGNGNSGWAINSDIYQSLGSPPLSTIEEIGTYLALVKSKLPGVTPLEVDANFAGLEIILRSFAPHFYIDGQRPFSVESSTRLGKLFKNNAFRRGMTVVNGWFRDGLITPDAFTQTRDQAIARLAQSKAAMVVTGDLGLVIEGNQRNTVAPNLYRVIVPPAAPGVDRSSIAVSYYSTLGWNVNVFSRQASNIDKILRLLDWLTGPEGQNILMFGPPGLYWDTLDSNGIPVWNANYLKLSQRDLSQVPVSKWNWVGNTSWVDQARFIMNSKLPLGKQDPNFIWQKNIVWKYNMDITEFTYLDPSPDSEIGLITAKIRKIYQDARTRAVFAKSNSELIKTLDREQNELDDAGYATFLAYNQAHWLKNKRQRAD